MIYQKNLPFFNVVASGTASLELPLGMTYHRIVLKLGGTSFAKSNITEIRCKLNGKVFYTITGSRLDAINQYKGLAADASFLTIDFSEPFAKTTGGMLLGGIGTATGVQSFTIEVDISGATAPTLDSWSMLSEPMELGIIFGLVHHPVSFAAGGEFPIVLPHGPDAQHLIKRVNFFHTNMTSLEVKKNGIAIFEDLDTTTNEYIQEEVGRVAQSGLYVYDPIVMMDVGRVVNTATARDLRFNVTVSAADTIDVYAEYLGTLQNF